MDSENRKEFTGLMFLFRSNTPVSEKRLLRKYDLDKIKSAEKKGFIRITKNVNDDKDKYYIITNEGKKFWE